MRELCGVVALVTCTSFAAAGSTDREALDPSSVSADVRAKILGPAPRDARQQEERSTAPTPSDFTSIDAGDAATDAVVHYPGDEGAEQLFAYPIDEDITWPNMQTLLRNQANNLLYNHLSLGEDEAITLGPDCADLPYFLRMYFAWKASLPFGFRSCSRGRPGRPPSCGDPTTNTIEREVRGGVPAFSQFARAVRDGVHSASARTHPAVSRAQGRRQGLALLLCSPEFQRR